MTSVNPYTPVAQKVVQEVVFRRFQGEEVEFFLKSDLTDPLRFLMRENTNLSRTKTKPNMKQFIKRCISFTIMVLIKKSD